MENMQNNASILKKVENFLNSESRQQNENNVEVVQLLQELFAIISEQDLEENEIVKAENEFINDRKSIKQTFTNQLAGLYRIRAFPIESWKNTNWENSDKHPFIMELASDRFCEILGITVARFAKKPFLINEFIHPNDKKSFIEANETANIKFIPFQWDGRFLVKGKIKWVRLESLPRKLENGDILWTGVLSDMTEKVELEVALHATKLELEDVLIGANIGTLEWNIQTGKVKFNKIWAKNLGYSPAELKVGSLLFGSRGWKMITHPDDIGYANEMLERHFSGEMPHYAVEVRMKHKKGYWVWIRQEGKVRTWTADGKPLLMYGTHTDITQRKQAEEELEKSNVELEKRVTIRTAELEKLNADLKQTEQKFQTITDFTTDWEYWRSPENKIIYMSPSVERITGYSIREFENNPGLIDQIIGQHDFEL